MHVCDIFLSRWGAAGMDHEKKDTRATNLEKSCKFRVLEYDFFVAFRTSFLLCLGSFREQFLVKKDQQTAYKFSKEGTLAGGAPDLGKTAMVVLLPFLAA